MNSSSQRKENKEEAQRRNVPSVSPGRGLLISLSVSEA